MANFLEYNPEQAYLLPPTVREVLREGHLCFFVHGAVEKLDSQEFEAGYSDEGHPAYHPALLLKVWLYAYALGMTSSRRLEQRIREDLAFRYLAGGAQPDFWALNEFRKRHGRAMNDIFTQVVELARSLGLGKLGHVAIDSTRIAANAATSCTDSLEKLRAERAKIRKNIRRWQQIGLLRVVLQKIGHPALLLSRQYKGSVKPSCHTDSYPPLDPPPPRGSCQLAGLGQP